MIKNKKIARQAEKYVETAQKDTYAIQKAFTDGAKWMQDRLKELNFEKEQNEK